MNGRSFGFRGYSRIGGCRDEYFEEVIDDDSTRVGGVSFLDAWFESMKASIVKYQIGMINLPIIE